MAILKTALPKPGYSNPHYFDISGKFSHLIDTNYQFIETLMSVRLANPPQDDLSFVYINDVSASTNLRISTRYTSVNIWRSGFTEEELKDAKIQVKNASSFVDVDIEHVKIVSTYYQPTISSFEVLELYINGYSRIKFTGNQYTTGIKGSVTGGVFFEEQAIPGTLVVNKSNNKATGEVLIPPGHFRAGANYGRLWGMNHTTGEREGRDVTYGTATTFPANVADLKLLEASPCKDEPNTLTWTANPQQLKYQFKYKAEDGVDVVSGEIETTISEHIIPPATLLEGSNELSIRFYDGYVWSEWATITTTAYAYGVTTLEPSGVAQNKDLPIRATWGTNGPQEQLQLGYTVGGVEQPIINLTSENEYIIPASTFGVETVTLKVRTHNGYVWSDWKSATFITYGKPETPTLALQAEYDTSTPTFTWESVGQVSYRLQILKDEMLVLDSADVYSGVKEHTFTTALENNVVYTARLSIKNQYEYASDWDTKEFKIVFQELQKPRFDMFGDDKLGRIMFNIYNAEGQIDFAYCELYRREYGESEWTKIATDLELNSMYTDYTCRSGVLYEYKASAVSLTGGYTDSDIALKEVKLRNTMISDASDHNEYVVLIHNPTKTRGFTKETHAMQYSGLKFPSFEFGEVRYTNMNISFTVDAKTLDKLLDLYYSNNVLLFRDNRGKKIYGHISGEPSVEDAEFMKYTVSFPFTETNFNEGV